jgi:glycosyltransferase involved in cell wall biosynthesis
MKNVLIIAYYFPPTGMGGVQRVQKFCKYLPDFGWKPIVLTIEGSGHLAQDLTLLEEIKGKVKIYRTVDPLGFREGLITEDTQNFESLQKNRNLKIAATTTIYNAGRKMSSWFLFPDSKIGWMPNAMKKGMEIIQNEKIDLLFSTAPPNTSLITGLLLKRRTGLPLVCDFRDPWTESFFFNPPTVFHRLLHESFEKRVLKFANHVIAVNHPLKELFDQKLPLINREKVSVITHGYDAEDFRKISKSPITKHKSRFTIVHVGTLNKWSRPDPLLHAVKGLIEEKKLTDSEIEVHFIGSSTDRDQKLTQDSELERVVKFTPYLTHRKSLQYLQDADILWLTISGETDKGGKYRSTGKLYEYLGARKPILASAPLDGAAARVIRETGTGATFDPQDISGLKNSIWDFFQRKKEDTLKEFSKEKVERFERKHLTKNLSELFERALAESQ